MKKWTKKTGKVFTFGMCKISYHQLITMLGEEHFIEKDVSKTHSVIERYWAYEFLPNVALAFCYLDMKEELLIGTNELGKITIEDIEQCFNLKLDEMYGVIWD